MEYIRIVSETVKYIYLSKNRWNRQEYILNNKNSKEAVVLQNTATEYMRIVFENNEIQK